MKIKVVDSMMGKGKSSWSIQHMNKKQKEGERFIYVTPYLDEVDRVKKQCGFEEPDLSSSSKLDSLKKIIANNKSIATTHALFKMLDNEVLELLSVGYTLILDEVLDVVEETTLPKGDIDNMIKLKMLKYDGDKLVIDDEKVVKEKSEIENEYQNIAFNLLRKNLDIINGNKKIALIWLFPIDILKCFEEVYILTFMFDGYPMKGYLDAHGIKQIKYSVYCSNPEEEYENRIFKLKDYEYPNIKDIQHLIEVADKGKINDIGESDSSFSFTWWEKLIKDKSHFDWVSLKKNINNFLVNYANTTSPKRIIWTTFTKARSGLYTKSLNDDNFVANNIRATNRYRDMDIIIYLINKNYNPILINWFKSKNLKINEDMYALGEMIQCIWRGSIRDNKKVVLYIPSKRMRKLMTNFIEGKNG